MQGLKEEARRIIIRKFYENHKNKGKPYTRDHFLKMGMPRSTIYDVMRRVDK